MSEENGEIVRRVNDAFRAADWDAALSPYDDEAELRARSVGLGDKHVSPAALRGLRGFLEPAASGAAPSAP